MNTNLEYSCSKEILHKTSSEVLTFSLNKQNHDLYLTLNNCFNFLKVKHMGHRLQTPSVKNSLLRINPNSPTITSMQYKIMLHCHGFHSKENAAWIIFLSMQHLYFLQIVFGQSKLLIFNHIFTGQGAKPLLSSLFWVLKMMRNTCVHGSCAQK